MSKELATFLLDVWGREERTRFLATKQEGKFRVSSPMSWPENAQGIIKAVTAINSTKDVYFTGGSFIDPKAGKHKDNGFDAKALWVDIDGDKEGQGTPKEALTKLISEGLIPRPTYRIQTSTENSQHWWWILEEYVPAETINDLNRRIAYYLNADTACWDISHVMRVPGTYNLKKEHRDSNGNPPMVTIMDNTEEIHPVDRFDGLPKVKEQIKEALDLGEIPTIEQVFMRYPWSNEYADSFHKTKEAFWDEDKKDYASRGMAMVRLAYFCAEVGMNDAAIYAVLDDVDSRWGKFEGRRDREYQLVTIIHKVRTKYPSEAFVVQVDEDMVEDKAVYGFAEFLKSKFEYKWIYENFMGENTINFVTGLSGVGKSRFILQLCSSMALGRDFLGYSLKGEPRKVLFLSLEMGGPVLKKFMVDLTRAENFDKDQLKQLDDNFKVVPAGEPLPLTSPAGLAFITSTLDTHSPDILFIDAMGSLDFDELKETVSKKIMNTLKMLLNERHISIFLVHHNRKPEAAATAKPPSLSDFYGNTYGATDAATVVSLWRNPKGFENTLELHTLKSRIGVTQEPLLLDSTAFTFKLKGIANGNPVENKPESRQTSEPESGTPQPGYTGNDDWFL